MAPRGAAARYPIGARDLVLGTHSSPELTTAEDVAAVGSVAVLVGPPAAIVIAGPPAATPVPRFMAWRERMPLDPSPEDTVAEVAAKMNVDRMAAAAIRRCRVGVYGRGAKGYRSSKTENVISHSVCSFVTVRAGRSKLRRGDIASLCSSRRV